LRRCVTTDCSNVYWEIQKGNEKKETRDTENTKDKKRTSAVGRIKNKGACIRRQETRMNGKGRTKQILCGNLKK
jgi:hypothetical protein